MQRLDVFLFFYDRHPASPAFMLHRRSSKLRMAATFAELEAPFEGPESLGSFFEPLIIGGSWDNRLC